MNMAVIFPLIGYWTLYNFDCMSVADFLIKLAGNVQLINVDITICFSFSILCLFYLLIHLTLFFSNVMILNWAQNISFYSSFNKSNLFTKL